MNSIKTIDPLDLDQPVLHHLLLSAVAPRPICFASTIDTEGRVNLSPFSFFNIFSSDPPILIFSPAKGRTGHKNTFDNVKEVKEVVINIVNYPIVEQMSLSSTAYAKGVNEFIKSGLTEVPSNVVQPPRVAEAPVSLECIVENIIELGDNPGAGNLIIVKVVMIHVQKKYLDEDGKLDTKKLDLVARMGGNWYSRMTEDSLFEIPKPLGIIGIGINMLPQSIRESKILTGNNLARVGSLEAMPNKEEIEHIKNHISVKNILSKLQNEPSKIKNELVHLAQLWIEKMDSKEALSLLLYADKMS
ncbi:MAG: flavin reductase family protein [Saprospiraceae bacterium]